MPKVWGKPPQSVRNAEGRMPVLRSRTAEGGQNAEKDRSEGEELREGRAARMGFAWGLPAHWRCSGETRLRSSERGTGPGTRLSDRASTRLVHVWYTAGTRLPARVRVPLVRKTRSECSTLWYIRSLKWRLGAVLAGRAGKGTSQRAFSQGETDGSGSDEAG